MANAVHQAEPFVARPQRASNVAVVFAALSAMAAVAGALLSWPLPDFPAFVRSFILGDTRSLGVVLGLLGWSGLNRVRNRRGGAQLAGVVAAAISAIVCVAAAHGWYGVRQVWVQSGDGVQLSGTLYRPRWRPVHTGVLLVGGSAPVAGERYHAYADRLARAGHLVLLPDRRGTGRSGGVVQQQHVGRPGERAALDTLAMDVGAFARELQRVAALEHSRIPIGFFGLSQAGWVIPLAAAATDVARFMILLSAPAVSSREEEAFSDQSGEDADHFGWRPPPIPFSALDSIAESTSSGGFDPRPLTGALDVPSLWIFGEWDNSIPVRKSQRILDSLAATGRPIEVLVLPAANHGGMVMRGPTRGWLPSYSPALWPQALRFLRRFEDTAPQERPP